MKPSFNKWIVATRPWSLPASVMPVLLTIAFFISENGFNWAGEHVVEMILTVVAMIFVHLGGNIVSDVFDYKHGVDRADTFGSSRMLVDGVFTPRAFMVYGSTLLFLSSVIGIYLAFTTSLALLWVGVTGVCATFFYYKFKYSALGDMLILLLFSIFPALGTGLILTGEWSGSSVLVVAPVGLLVVAILHANNMRDIIHDLAVPIRTVASTLGFVNSQRYYALLEILPYCFLVGFAVTGFLSPYVLLTFLTLPLAVKNVRLSNQALPEAPELIKTLDAESAKLVMGFSLVYIVTLIISIL